MPWRRSQYDNAMVKPRPDDDNGEGRQSCFFFTSSSPATTAAAATMLLPPFARSSALSFLLLPSAASVSGFLPLLSPTTAANNSPLELFAPTARQQLLSTSDGGGSATSSFAFFSSFSPQRRGQRSVSSAATQNDDDDETSDAPDTLRIGIVGGGIAGVTAAHAVAERQRLLLLQNQRGGEKQRHYYQRCDVCILEAGMPAEADDGNSGNNNNNSNAALVPGEEEQRRQQPAWKAATAWNGNSLVPGVSFSVLSQRATLVGVLRDTATELYELHCPAFLKPTKTRQEDELEASEFAAAPPYFALHPWRCLVGGPDTTSAERVSFVRFVAHYLYYALWLGQDAADARATHLGTLAQTNRNLYDRVIRGEGMPETKPKTKTTKNADSSLADAIGHSRGFLSLHRTLEEAELTLRHIRSVAGEEAELLPDWDAACAAEPRLRDLPPSLQPLHVVRRPNDYTASCNAFTRKWIRSCQEDLGVQYITAQVETITTTATTRRKGGRKDGDGGDDENKNKKTEKASRAFRVVAKDGSVHEFDLLVLAAGINTPLLAAQLGAAKYCPTYPLRGFSLTTYFDPPPTTTENENNNDERRQQEQQHHQSRNLLRQPFKLDSMYCTSVSPRMARWVGFGEFAGYHASADDVPSIAPSVLSRYARAVFPDAARIGEAVACFRSMSPDDLPLVGEVPIVDGLFLCTGHGSLGWTLGLATGEMLAQSIEHKLQGRNNDEQGGGEEGTELMYQLSDGSLVDPKVFSPKRFVT